MSDAATSSYDVAVVGAGPAGIAAACRAAEAGARTILMDEGLAPGGQIYRQQPGRRAPERAEAWFARLARSGATRLARTAVVDAVPADGEWSLAAETPDGPLHVRASRVVLATGARELFLPFPGWTLPNAMGAGGAQALVKSGLRVEGRVAVVAGSGPLLLPVAATLAKAGAKVAVVAEQARLPDLAMFAATLTRTPSKLVEAARYTAAFRDAKYRTGVWVSSASGRDRVSGAVLTDGRRAERIACDLLCVSYGLVPNTELARVVGCAVSGGAVVTNDAQETSVAGVFAAGEPCGVGGVDVALVEGEIAGLAAAGRFHETAKEGRRLLRERAAGRRAAAALDRAFRLRRELADLARPDTIVCRCEDVRHESLDARWSVRQAKLYTRAGMGPCQGRVCGPALSYLFGWEGDAPRPPLKPVPLETLGSTKETT